MFLGHIIIIVSLFGLEIGEGDQDRRWHCVTWGGGIAVVKFGPGVNSREGLSLGEELNVSMSGGLHEVKGLL